MACKNEKLAHLITHWHTHGHVDHTGTYGRHGTGISKLVRQAPIKR